jgi:glycosyltransferase involved in cell wall biosynthesis
VIAQDFEDFELLLTVELRSTDRSVEICKNFADADRRVRILGEDGTGFPAARNRGLDEARGEFITFVDADDYILPGMFRAMCGQASKQNLDILCCGGKKDLGDLRVEDMDDYVKFSNELFAVNTQNERDYMYKLAVNGRTITAWGKFYRREFLERNRLRFHPEAYSDDFVFNFACYTAAERVGTTGESYYVYYDRRDSRVYTSDISDIERSAEIIWSLYLDYSGGAAADDVRAFAAVRIVSSTLFNLKLKNMPVERLCEIVWRMIQNLKMEPYLLRAADENRFCDYISAVAVTAPAAEDYLKFIRSLREYNTMLAWQEQYVKVD